MTITTMRMPVLHHPLPVTPWDVLSFGASLLAWAAAIFAVEGGNAEASWAAVSVAICGIIVPVVRMYLADKWKRHDMANKVNVANLNATLAQKQAEAAAEAVTVAKKEADLAHERLAVAENRNAFLEGRVQTLEDQLGVLRGRVEKNQDSIRKMEDSGPSPVLKVEILSDPPLDDPLPQRPA